MIRPPDRRDEPPTTPSLSAISTRSAPASRADSAADSPAAPDPTTSTSTSVAAPGRSVMSSSSVPARSAEDGPHDVVGAALPAHVGVGEAALADDEVRAPPLERAHPLGDAPLVVAALEAVHVAQPG